VSLQLERPAVVDLVAIEAVDALLENAQRELAALDYRAREVTALAAKLEAQARDEGVHPDVAVWMLGRFSTFLDIMRDEGHAEAAAIVEHARRIAAQRLAPPLRLSFEGAWSTRKVRVNAEPKLCWNAPPHSLPVRESLGVTITLPEPEPKLEPASPAPVAPTSAVQVTLEPPATDFDFTADADAEVVPAPEREFWPEAEEPRRWWRRLHIGTAAALTVSAILLVVLAVVVQVV